MVNELIDGKMKLLDGVFMQHEAKSGMYKVKEKWWQLSIRKNWFPSKVVKIGILRRISGETS